MSCCYVLNKLDNSTNGIYVAQAPSSALAALGTPQPGAFGFLNNVDPLVSLSNYYILLFHSHAVNMLIVLHYQLDNDLYLIFGF